MVIGVLFISALASWSLSLSRQGERYVTNLDGLPMQIGAWEGKTLPLRQPELVYAVLETSSVLSRVYEDGKGERVDLLVTYFQRGHRGFHPPEVSFVASGNTIARSGTVRIRLSGGDRMVELEANMFVGRTQTGGVLYLYWFGIGKQWMASYYKGSAHLLWSTIWRQPETASMVRLALPIVRDDFESTMSVASEFTRVLLGILPEYLTEHPVAAARR